LPLTSVKVDEGYQGKKSFLEVSGALADLLALAGPELQEFLTSNSEGTP
jgi:hypothetical protein